MNGRALDHMPLCEGENLGRSDILLWVDATKSWHCPGCLAFRRQQRRDHQTQLFYRVHNLEICRQL